MEQEASSLFPQGKVYASRAHLREEVRDFADRKGFAVASAALGLSNQYLR
jgi:hypothetical protein